jgi:EAL domain
VSGASDPNFTPLVELPRRKLFGFVVECLGPAPHRIASAHATAAGWSRGPDRRAPIVLIDLELDEIEQPATEVAMAALIDGLGGSDGIVVRIPYFGAGTQAPAVERLVERGVAIAVAALDLRGVEFGLLAGAPIDMIQLPPAAISEIDRSREAVDHLRGVISIAHRHDWMTLASQINRASQLDALEHLGCDLVIGPVVGPTMTRSEVDRTVRRYTRVTPSLVAEST